MTKQTLLLALPLLVLGCDQAAPPEPTLALALDGVELTDEGHADGAFQPGETAGVSLYLTNASDSTYRDLRFRPSSAGGATASGASLSSGPIGFDRVTLGPGERVHARFAVEVDENLPSGTDLALAVAFTDGRGAETSFSVPSVVEPLPYAPVLVAHGVRDDSDGDGRLEPGEEARLAFEVASDPAGAAPCLGDRVRSEVEVSFPAASGHSCVTWSERWVRFRLASTVAPGSDVPFTIEVSDHLGNDHPFDVRVPVQ